MLDGAKCKILKTMPLETSELAPAETSTTGKRLRVGTGNGDLEIVTFQPAGKKAMESKAYLNGHPEIKFEP